MLQEQQKPTEGAELSPRRGKVIFAFKLVMFSAVQLSLLTAVELKLAQFPNPYYIKIARLQSAANAQMLLVGSSHILNGLNPDELGVPTINLAGYSQDLYYDSQLVLRSLDRLPALECVVLGLSYFTLEYDMETSSEAWRACYYRRCFGIPHRHLLNEFDLRNVSLFLLYGPETSWQLLTGQSPDLSAFVQGNGWAANPVPDNPSVAVSDGPARAALHHKLMHAENVAPNLAILDHLLDVLQQRGICIVLVTTPVQPTYSAELDPQSEVRFRQAIAHLQSSHGAHYFDFSSDQRFEICDFYNSDHLNRNGATKLSHLLSRDLEAILPANNALRISSQQQPKAY